VAVVGTMGVRERFFAVASDDEQRWPDQTWWGLSRHHCFSWSCGVPLGRGQRLRPGSVRVRCAIVSAMSCSRRTNSWLTNFVQLWRNTDRQPHHRLSQLALAITIAAKPIDWKNRWNLNQAPIRCAS